MVGFQEIQEKIKSELGYDHDHDESIVPESIHFGVQKPYFCEDHGGK